MAKKKDRKELRYGEELQYRAEIKQSHADKGVAHKNNQRKRIKQEDRKKVKTQGNIRSTG